jgi:hypothetical protein
VLLEGIFREAMKVEGWVARVDIMAQTADVVAN